MKKNIDRWCEIEMAEYIYLIQLREFIGKNVYKIGRTKQEGNKRINQYPNGSILQLQIKCNNCTELETKLIKLFKDNYIHKREYGNEYFEGDVDKMIEDIYNVKNVKYQNKYGRDKSNELKRTFKCETELAWYVAMPAPLFNDIYEDIVKQKYKFKNDMELKWSCIFTYFKWNWIYDDILNYFTIIFKDIKILTKVVNEENIWLKQNYNQYMEEMVKSWKDSCMILGSNYHVNSHDYVLNDFILDIGCISYQYGHKFCNCYHSNTSTHNNNCCVVNNCLSNKHRLSNNDIRYAHFEKQGNEWHIGLLNVNITPGFNLTRKNEDSLYEFMDVWNSIDRIHGSYLFKKELFKLNIDEKRMELFE
jgi:hypothetical protein